MVGDGVVRRLRAADGRRRPSATTSRRYETHAGRWIGFRQPVLRGHAELAGRPVERTYEANPGEVWEEDEFWIDLSWRIDPDGELGIRSHFESLERPGEPIGVDEYYEYLFTHSIPGLPEAAAAEGVSPLEYMRRYGAFAIPGDSTRVHERARDRGRAGGHGARRTDGVLPRARNGRAARRPRRDRGPHAVHRRRLDRCRGRRDAAGRLPDAARASSSCTRRRWPTWGWPEYALPDVHPQPRPLGGPRSRRRRADPLPTFRLPDADPHPLGQLEVARTRSATAIRCGSIPATPSSSVSSTGELVRVDDADRSVRDQGVAYRGHPARCGRLLAPHGSVAARRAAGQRALVVRRGRRSSTTPTAGTLRLRTASSRSRATTPTSSRVWWTDAGVHQNLTFPRAARSHVGDALLAPAGDDHARRARRPLRRRPRRHRGSMSRLRGVAGQLTRPGPGPGDLRRPLWFARPVKPRRHRLRLPSVGHLGAGHGSRVSRQGGRGVRRRDRDRARLCGGVRPGASAGGDSRLEPRPRSPTPNASFGNSVRMCSFTL